MKEQKKTPRHLWILFVGFVISAAVAGIFYIFLQQESQENMDRIKSSYTERTENFINAVFHKTDVLAAVVKLENGDISEATFNEVAAIVYQKDSGIRGIQYMPNAIPTYSYPLEGNEAVMGKNFLEIPERREDCLLAINTRSIALSGPYNLIQGGLGLVARNPVFLTDSDGKEYFWGFSAIVLDLPDALEAVGLGNLSESGYDFQLFCVNENNERLVIEGNGNLDVTHADCGTITVPHHEWTLALVELHPWANLIRACVLFVCCLTLSLLLWRFYRTVLKERAAVRSKDEFFSDISHDMRTPLNAILGFSSLAQTPGISDETKDDYIRKIESSGKLMLNLVNDTLTVSKSDSGKLALKPAPVFTEKISESITVPIREMADQKGVTFTFDSSRSRARMILADQMNLQKIFLNLLNNAVKFTPKGGHVSVTVYDEPSAAAEPDTVFVIRDDGIGISSEFMPHLFEPFAQEQKSGYEGTGTGLGLTIAKRIVTLMGGTISVKSEEGEGTEFTVRLHFKEVQQEQPEERKPAAEASQRSFTCLKILLCEDNELNRQIASALLESRGILYDTAVNGAEAVEKFSASRENEYGAVLMDIRMPVMDGFQATKEIRSLNRKDAKTVSIIAMTADVFDEDIQKCLAAGMNGHIAKPIDPEKLFQAISEAIKTDGN
ncbi:MAG TPA: ATP-binding protein [Lachnospiraceae bacterium]|nr:ATP-binding protein [Lachnospiraceae bacterium]